MFVLFCEAQVYLHPAVVDWALVVVITAAVVVTLTVVAVPVPMVLLAVVAVFGVVVTVVTFEQALLSAIYWSTVGELKVFSAVKSSGFS